MTLGPIRVRRWIGSIVMQARQPCFDRSCCFGDPKTHRARHRGSVARKWSDYEHSAMSTSSDGGVTEARACHRTVRRPRRAVATQKRRSHWHRERRVAPSTVVRGLRWMASGAGEFRRHPELAVLRWQGFARPDSMVVNEDAKEKLCGVIRFGSNSDMPESRALVSSSDCSLPTTLVFAGRGRGGIR